MNHQIFSLNDDSAKIPNSSHELISLHSKNDGNPGNSLGNLNNASSSIIHSLTKKFIYLLKCSTSLYRFRSLNENAYALINDRAFCSLLMKENTTIQNQLVLNILQYIKKIVAFVSFAPFHPDNNFQLIWNIIHFFFILILLFFIPINVCFSLDLDKEFRVIFGLFFCGDILMNMNTSFFNKGFLINKRKDIMLHYVKSEMFNDLLTVTIYLVNLEGQNIFVFLKFLFFLRWRKISKIYSKIQEKVHIFFQIHPSVIDLGNLWIFSLFFLNIFACFWYYIAMIHENDADYVTWLTTKNLSDESLLHKYFYSFYWSAVTIMTVGYGDISATNITEILFSIFTTIFGCGLFAYFINSIGIIVQEITKESSLFKAKINVINKYMNKKGINHNLQMRIREYLRFIWQEESTQNVEIENEIIGKLSRNLRSELIFESYGKIFRNSPLFYANFSEKCLMDLMVKINEVRFIPEDLIFEPGTQDEKEIYFIVKGGVALYYTKMEDDTTKIKNLKDGNHFGELCFFTGGERKLFAKSTDFTTLFTIKREDFLHVLSKYPEDFEKYCMIRDELIFQNKTNFLQTKCFSCSSKGHLSTYCPLIHYIPNRMAIVKKFLRDPGQKTRIPYQRSQRMRFPTLFSLKYVQDCNKRFRNFSPFVVYDYGDADFEEAGLSPITLSNFNELENKEKNRKKLHINTNVDRMLQSQKNYQNFTKENKENKETNLESITRKNSVSQFFFTNQSMNISEQENEDSFEIKLPNLMIFQENSDKTEPENEGFPLKLPESYENKKEEEKYLERRMDNRKSIFGISMPNRSPLLKKKSTEIYSEPKSKPEIKSFIQDNMQDIEQKDSENMDNDGFSKEFEKGVNYKNFFPKFNLNNILNIQKKERKKNILHLEQMQQNNKKFQRKATMIHKTKTKKIVPAENEPYEQKNNVFSPQNNIKKQNNPSIFSQRNDFFSDIKKKYTFYEVVKEVLTNQELRKKLLALKQKTLKMRKNKAN